MRTSHTLCLFLLLSGCAGGDDAVNEPLAGDEGGKADGTGGTQYYRLRFGEIDVPDVKVDALSKPDPQVCVDGFCSDSCSNTLSCEARDGGWLHGGKYTGAELMGGFHFKIFDADIGKSDLIAEGDAKMTRTSLKSFAAGDASVTFGAQRLCTPAPAGATLTGRVLQYGRPMNDVEVRVTAPEASEVSSSFYTNSNGDFVLNGPAYCAVLHVDVIWTHDEYTYNCGCYGYHYDSSSGDYVSGSYCGFCTETEHTTLFNSDVDLRQLTDLQINSR